MYIHPTYCIQHNIMFFNLSQSGLERTTTLVASSLVLACYVGAVSLLRHARSRQTTREFERVRVRTRKKQVASTARTTKEGGNLTRTTTTTMMK